MEYLGFTRDDIEIAEFERKLWEDEKLEEFKKSFEEESGKTWKDGNRNLDFLFRWFYWCCRKIRNYE